MAEIEIATAELASDNRGTISRDNSQAIAFSWMTQRAPLCRAYAILNDTGNPFREQLCDRSYEVHSVPWLSRQSATEFVS